MAAGAPSVGGRVAIVTLEPEVTEEQIDRIGRELGEEATREALGGVVLDFSRAPVVDGSTARACRELARALGLLGVPVALSGLSAGAAGCLALLGFDPEPLRPVRTPEDARALFGARGG